MNLGGGFLEEDPADATTEGDDSCVRCGDIGDVIDDESSIERDAIIGVGDGDGVREEDRG